MTEPTMFAVNLSAELQEEVQAFNQWLLRVLT